MAVYDSTLADLTELGAVETVAGQCALVLAEQLDASRKNGLAVPPTVARLLDVMAEIRDGVKTEGDSVDDSRDETERILRSVG